MPPPPALPVPPAEPPAPPGPGVAPPFVAPPTDRDNRTLWIGLGVGGVVFVLCCVGGLIGAALLISANSRELETSAREAVTEYLEDLRTQRYSEAYDRLCSKERNERSLSAFTRIARQDPVLGFSVQDVTIGSEVTVDASVDYRDGGTRQREYLLETEIGGSRSGSMSICGER
jgi:hypothetical protein